MMDLRLLYGWEFVLSDFHWFSVEFGCSVVLFLKSCNFHKWSTVVLFRASFSDQVQRFFSSVLADATCACLNILSNLFSAYVVVLKFSSFGTCSVQQHISPFAACSGHLGREQWWEIGAASQPSGKLESCTTFSPKVQTFLLLSPFLLVCIV